MAQLALPPVQVRVLARRPSNSYGELHGLYEPRELEEYARGERAVVTVWMRTAQKEQIVKFRTFLRTVVHEMAHHFDYELYKLPETFHTEGFYARESALMRELLAASRAKGEGVRGLRSLSRCVGMVMYSTFAQRSAKLAYHGDITLPDWPVDCMKSDFSRSAKS